jgi:hypothetical protein
MSKTLLLGLGTLVSTGCGVFVQPDVHMASAGAAPVASEVEHIARDLLRLTAPYGLEEVNVELVGDGVTPWLESEGRTIRVNEAFATERLAAGPAGEEMLRYAFAHELGHILSGCNSGVVLSPRGEVCPASSLACELEADTVAAEIGYEQQGRELIEHLLGATLSCAVRAELELRLAALKDWRGEIPTWRQLLDQSVVQEHLKGCESSESGIADDCVRRRVESLGALRTSDELVFAERPGLHRITEWQGRKRFGVIAGVDYQFLAPAGNATGPGVGGRYAIVFAPLTGQGIAMLGPFFAHTTFPTAAGDAQGSRRYDTGLLMKMILPLSTFVGWGIEAGLGAMFRSVDQGSTDTRFVMPFRTTATLRVLRGLYLDAGGGGDCAVEPGGSIEYRAGPTVSVTLLL